MRARTGADRGLALRACALVAPVLLVGVVAGCTAQPATTLRFDNNERLGLANNAVPYDSPLSFGSIPLCVDGPGEAVVTGVAIHESDGTITVDAFAVRRHDASSPGSLGNARGALATLGFEPGSAVPIDRPCAMTTSSRDDGRASAWYELGVEVSWTAGDLAGGPDLEVTYAVGDASSVLIVPWEIWLCRATCPDEVFRY